MGTHREGDWGLEGFVVRTQFILSRLEDQD